MNFKQNRALEWAGRGQAEDRIPGSSPGWTSHYPELSAVAHNSSSVGNQQGKKNQVKKSGRESKYAGHLIFYGKVFQKCLKLKQVIIRQPFNNIHGLFSYPQSNLL